MRGVNRRGPWKALAVVLVLAALSAAIGLHLRRSDPSAIPQSRLHEWGTQGNATRMTRVRLHPVEFANSPRSVRDLPSYVGRLLSSAATVPASGLYDPSNGRIVIAGPQELVEASLPVAIRPTLLHTLRHEYGHAAFWDWMEDQELLGGEMPVEQLGLPRGEQRTSAFPPSLRGPIEEWQDSPPSLYRIPYATSTFHEYIAESYARLLVGASVPPQTRAFLSQAYRAKPKGR